MRRKSKHTCIAYHRGKLADRAVNLAAALSDVPNLTAFVFDTKQFYPHVAPERVLGRFREKVGRTELTTAGKEAAIAIAEQLMNIRGHKGIPIGPALSHVLGNIAMEPVDAAMIKRHEGRYFRYVDDIILVGPRDSHRQIVNELKHVLAVEALELNDAKSDQVSGEEWSQKSSMSNRHDEGASI